MGGLCHDWNFLLEMFFRSVILHVLNSYTIDNRGMRKKGRGESQLSNLLLSGRDMIVVTGDPTRNANWLYTCSVPIISRSKLKFETLPVSGDTVRVRTA